MTIICSLCIIKWKKKKSTLSAKYISKNSENDHVGLSNTLHFIKSADIAVFEK